MSRITKAVEALATGLTALSKEVSAQSTKNGETSSEVRLVRVEQQSRWDIQYETNKRHEAQMKDLWAMLADKAQNQ